MGRENDAAVLRFERGLAARVLDRRRVTAGVHRSRRECAVVWVKREDETSASTGKVTIPRLAGHLD